MTTLLPSRRLERTGDADLVRMTRKGDTDAYAALFRRHAHAAAAVARSVTSTFEPDDLVSEAYTRILQALRAGKGPTGAFRPYLFTTVRNIAASWGRGNKNAVPLDPEELDAIAFTEDDSLAALDRSLTAQAFRTLPARWQEALWYSEVEGIQPAEMAPMLGMRASAAAALCYRAREGLRQAWIQAHLASSNLEPECRWTVDRLPARERGRLGKRDRSRVDAHLDTCAKCRMAAAEAHEAGDRLVLVLLPLTIGATAATAYLAAVKTGIAGATVAAAGAGAEGLGAAGVGAAGSGAVGSGAAAGSAGSAGSSGSAGAGGAAASAAGASAAGSGMFSGVTGVVIGTAAAVVIAGAAVAGVLVMTSPHESDAASRSVAGTASSDASSPRTSGPGTSGPGTSDPGTSGGTPTGRSSDGGASDGGSSDGGSSSDGAVPASATDTGPGDGGNDPSSSGSSSAGPPSTSPSAPPTTPPGDSGGDGGSQTPPVTTPPTTTPPVTPPATPPAAPSVTADTGNGLYFPLVSGTAEPNATVTVSGGGSTTTTVADASGAWSVDTAFTGFGAGAGTVTATQTDTDGLTSPAASATFTLLAPQFTASSTLLTTTLDVTGVPDTSVQVLLNGSVQWTVSLGADGTGSKSVFSLFAQGETYQVGVRYSDGSGRFGPTYESSVTVG